jgi:hypothetical protein
VRNNPRAAHPFYWAPFFLIGDPDNLSLGPERARPGYPTKLGKARKRSRSATSAR